MAAAPRDLDARQCHIARRLARLFRIERTGGFERRPMAVIRRVIERRGALIDELIACERRRPNALTGSSAALEQALTELAVEVQQARECIEMRLARLRTELGLRRGAGPPSGIRDRASGRLIGRG